MVDIVYNFRATERRSSQGLVGGKGDGQNVKSLVSSIELAVSSVGTTVRFGTIPSNARLHGVSKVYSDDLASAGAPTLDLGLGSVDTNITSDDDALSDGLDLASANAGGTALLGDIDRIGKKAYELVAGQTDDPNGVLEVFGTVKDAATTAIGTVAVELFYTID